MLENGAPPDKFDVLYRQLHIELHILTAGSMYYGYHTLVPIVLTQYFHIQYGSL